MEKGCPSDIHFLLSPYKVRHYYEKINTILRQDSTLGSKETECPFYPDHREGS
jgi:hypothetical protein